MNDRPPLSHAQLKQETAIKSHSDQTDLKKMDERLGIIHLLSGTTARNEEFYVYISVRPSVYEEFSAKTISGEEMNIESYGEVLKKGFGRQPSDEVKQYMTRKFGIDHDFVKHLAEALEKRKQEQA